MRSPATPAESQIAMPVDLPETFRPADDRYRLLVERIERLDGERRGIGEDIRDVYFELKSAGYDAKATRQVIRIRRMKPDVRRELDAIVSVYKAALGIE